ncbi:MAG: FAD-binding oxidoreductase [Gemmatimonadota bacterium]
MSHPIRSLLKTMVAPDAVVPDGEMGLWRTGKGEEGLPAAVLAPSNEEELARVLALASEEGWRVLPAGLGTWLEGGGPTNVTLVISTRRMREVREYEPADLTFTAGAGLSLAALRETTQAHGQWLPLDPPGGFQGSLGATVSLGTAGALRHLFGTPRDHVLGLTLVSGDGRVLRWGGRVVKNVAGFDVTRLCVGSWGSLGVVTSVSARLFPIPDSDVTLCIRGPDAATLLPLARAMALSPLPLGAVELVDPLGPEGSVKGAADEAPVGAALVLRLLGSRAQVTEMEARIRSDLSREVGSLERLEGEESRALQRTLNGWENGADLVARLCLLPSEMGDLLEEAGELRALSSKAKYGPPQLRLSAHVGAGVLRVAVSGLPSGEGDLAAWASSLRGLRERLEGKGGSLTLSSGPGSLVREVGAWGVSGGERELSAGLKAQFDPKGILAPGRLGLC